MDKDLFKDIMEQVEPFIQKETLMRDPLDPGLHNAITLRFLASGNSYTSLGCTFHVASNTISKIVPETCRSITSLYRGSLVNNSTDLRCFVDTTQSPINQ